MDKPTSKPLRTGLYQSEVHRLFYVHEHLGVTMSKIKISMLKIVTKMSKIYITMSKIDMTILKIDITMSKNVNNYVKN